MLLKILLLYLLIINAAGFLLMLVDKYKAKRKLWRIPEATPMRVASGMRHSFLFALYLSTSISRNPAALIISR